ncbi:hypothetical protein LTR78_007109 [Recurvomyces mirabilis]|uniref:Uncharacterized protein n=1 Tax=Recurvomyces mirabilis TaxID=574656 RepID=A0AAE0WJR7_9PEZI|nr:hypothetical protein LTR78_007109 [Recurvomyces mirabilis]KAK5150920.1 hypothetical protein LTS14_009723 [Recurvomyces mirabilis]
MDGPDALMIESRKMNLHAFIERNGRFAKWDKADPDDRRAMWLSRLKEFPCESPPNSCEAGSTLFPSRISGQSEEQIQYQMWATTMFDIMCEAVWMYRIQPNMDFLKTNQTVSGQREHQQNKRIFTTWKTLAQYPRIRDLKMPKQVDDWATREGGTSALAKRS